MSFNSIMLGDVSIWYTTRILVSTTLILNRIQTIKAPYTPYIVQLETLLASYENLGILYYILPETLYCRPAVARILSKIIQMHFFIPKILIPLVTLRLLDSTSARALIPGRGDVACHGDSCSCKIISEAV